MIKIIVISLIFILNLEIGFDSNIKLIAMQEKKIKVDTKEANTKEIENSTPAPLQRAPTQYYSLIYKDSRSYALDSNQKKFMSQIAILLNKSTNKNIAMISYVKGNKSQADDIKIAKKRTTYIIDFLEKNGVGKERISKRELSGIVAKQNVELYEKSNIIELMIVEKMNVKK